MITNDPLEPIEGHMAVNVALDVTEDGRLVVTTTAIEPGAEPQVARDVHTAEWSIAIAREIVARQETAARRAANGGE